MGVLVSLKHQKIFIKKSNFEKALKSVKSFIKKSKSFAASEVFNHEKLMEAETFEQALELAYLKPGLDEDGNIVSIIYTVDRFPSSDFAPYDFFNSFAKYVKGKSRLSFSVNKQEWDFSFEFGRCHLTMCEGNKVVGIWPPYKS